jgi:hypothetical protein
MEVTKMSFSRQMNKLWYIQKMKYYSTLKEMSYQVMKRHRRILNAYYKVKEGKTDWPFQKS